MSSQCAVQVTAPTALVTTAETVAATLVIPPESQPSGQGLYLDGELNVTAGASTTAVVVRVRQTGVAGALVGNAKTVTLAAAALGQIHFAAIDPTLAYPAGNTYVVTVQQTAATGNGTVNDATLRCDPITALAG